MKYFLLRFFLSGLLLAGALPSSARDILILKDNFWKTEVNLLREGFALLPTENFNPDSLVSLRYTDYESFIGDSLHAAKKGLIICFGLKNNTAENPVEIFISEIEGSQASVYYTHTDQTVSAGKEILIRGQNYYGSIQLFSGEMKKVFVILPEMDAESVKAQQSGLLSLINYRKFMEKELSSRFFHSVLLGLLFFSAFLNLILAIILKQKSFYYLFFYLLSLLVFSFSYLGFYSEFFQGQLSRIPIGVPLYFITLVLFLLISKNYLRLEYHLPSWNTISNVLIFFLLLSIPYYYLTVYSKNFYNNFVAFSSIFFLIVAALMCFLESVILYKKETKARFFLIANLVVVISIAANLLFKNRLPFVEGAVVQGFIFTFGLASEIKILNQKNSNYQHSLIKQLKLNLELKDKLTVELEQKVKERTAELTLSNQKLIHQNEVVEKQKGLLELRNKEIHSSITYARRIQYASFPDKRIIENFSKDYFVLHMPRDIVSGDFYWFSETKNKLILIIADCTGHGVPGAFMSMFGIAFLNEIVNKQKIDRPDLILNLLREKIVESLHRDEEGFETMDGMDMSILTIHRKTRKVLFSGANNSLYRIRNGELEIFGADRMPVAWYRRMEAFSLYELDFMEKDCYYLFTDGYYDQFGGKEGRKLMLKTLLSTLDKVYTLPMEVQGEELRKFFLSWKGEYKQIDDVLFLGLRT